METSAMDGNGEEEETNDVTSLLMLKETNGCYFIRTHLVVTYFIHFTHTQVLDN